MKKILIIIGFIIPFSGLSQPALLMESQIVGGMMPIAQDRRIQIFENGEVWSWIKSSCSGRAPSDCQPTTETKRLAILDSNVVQTLQNQIDPLSEEPGMYDYNQGEPFCYDAPVTYYRVFKPNQVEGLVIGYWERCHEYVLQVGQVSGMIKLLKGFIALAQY